VRQNNEIIQDKERKEDQKTRKEKEKKKLSMKSLEAGPTRFKTTWKVTEREGEHTKGLVLLRVG